MLGNHPGNHVTASRRPWRAAPEVFDMTGMPPPPSRWFGMVMNLDKYVSCHTCSATCKQTWTNRDGVE